MAILGNVIPYVFVALFLFCPYIFMRSTPQQQEQNQHSSYAFATITTPAFCMGAVALGHSLKKLHGDKYNRVCLMTQDVNESWVEVLSQWWDVRYVPEIPPTSRSRRSWIKLWLWNLTEYSKIVYFDTDMLVFQPVDELFNYQELSCAPDPNPPQICNTGVLVLNPSRETFAEIRDFSKQPKARYSVGDQGTINAYFKKFNPIPPMYNVPRIYSDGFERAKKSNSIKVLHFVCKKPWKCGRDEGCGCSYPEYNEIWWNTWDEACFKRKCMESWWEPLTGQGK